jgi:photosystem II stability/assembly factor-like uncharacterized protein
MTKIIFAILIIHCSLIFDNSFCQWYQQTSGTSEALTCVKFINSQTGFITSTNGKVLKTTNSGVNWFTNNITFYNLSKIQFINSMTGFLTSAYESYVTTGAVMKTTNAGSDWFYILNGGDGGRSVFFINDQTGFVGTGHSSMTGIGGIVLKTTNFGNNWQNSFGYYCNALHFFDANTGLAAGFFATDYGVQESVISRTTNGGVNWFKIFRDTLRSDLVSDIFFLNSFTGWAGGDTLLKTTNGGINWNPVYRNYHINSIYFTSLDTGWFAGGNQIRYTTNGGVNWISQSSGTTNYLYSIFFVNSNTGWAVGANGTILKTINGGVTSISKLSNEIPDNFILFQNYPNPFNPTTKIRFEIPLRKGGEGVVSLKVYNITGKELATLVNEQLQPGTYEVTFNGSNLSSGLYFYRLEASDFVQTKKLILLK